MLAYGFQTCVTSMLKIVDCGDVSCVLSYFSSPCTPSSMYIAAVSILFSSSASPHLHHLPSSISASALNSFFPLPLYSTPVVQHVHRSTLNLNRFPPLPLYPTPAVQHFHRTTLNLNRFSPLPLYPTLQGHRGAVLAVALSSDNGIMASGGEDNNVIVWDFDTHARLRVLKVCCCCMHVQPCFGAFTDSYRRNARIVGISGGAVS